MHHTFLGPFFYVLHYLPLTCSSFSPLMMCLDKANYDVKISGVEIKPYPVKRGKTATFSISASTGNYFVLLTTLSDHCQVLKICIIPRILTSNVPLDIRFLNFLQDMNYDISKLPIG